MERSLKYRKNQFHNRQSGFVIVATLFLIVVLALALAFASRYSSTSLSSQNKNLLAARAELAAEAALDWGVYQVVNASSCSPTANLSLNAFSEFTVTLECIVDSYNDGITLYRLTGESSYGTLGDVEYVYRQLTATLEL